MIYNKFIELTGIEKNNYFIYEIYEKLNNQNRVENFRPDIFYENEELLGEDFKLIYRQPIRRY